MMLPRRPGSEVGSSLTDSRKAETRFLVEGSESLILLRASITLFVLEPGLRGVGAWTDEGDVRDRVRNTVRKQKVQCRAELPVFPFVAVPVDEVCEEGVVFG